MELTRSMKRVAMLVLLAIVVILVSKSLLLKSVKNLSAEAEKKQQAKAVPETSALPVSAVEETSASAVANTGVVETEPVSAPVATENSAAMQQSGVQ